MRSAGLAFVVALAVTASPVGPLPQSTPTAFDPLGKWTISTKSDDGTPMTVNVEISGKPGSHGGKAVTSEGRELPLIDLATTPSGVIAVFALPQGVLVSRWSADANGRFRGDWAAAPQTIGLTAERVK